MNISCTVWNSCVWEGSSPAILGRRCALGGVGWHLLTRGGLHGAGPGCYYARLIHGFCRPLPSATAPQQEADPEVNTETLTKSSQGASSSTQAAPAESSASKEKETPAEKSKDGGSVSIPHALGPSRISDLPRSHPHGESRAVGACLSSGCRWGRWSLQGSFSPGVC